LILTDEEVETHLLR